MNQLVTTSITGDFTACLSHAWTIAGYVMQEPLSKCSPHALIVTIEGCQRAKAALEASASDVTSEANEYAPKGCNRYNGLWFFNTHETGLLDGLSQPVCKAGAGNSNRVLN